MTRLIVWRHGNTDWNAGDRVQGQTDVPLNARGRQQAEAAAELLAHLRPDAIVASDLLRAADTAAALARRTGHSVEFDKRLRERDFGSWQGLTMTEVVERYPDQHTRWRQSGEAGGDVETQAAVGSRMGEALLAAAALGDTVVVTSHGGAARYGLGQLLGWPVEVLRTLRGLENCHWIELTHDQRRGWQLASYNAGPPATSEPIEIR